MDKDGWVDFVAARSVSPVVARPRPNDADSQMELLWHKNLRNGSFAPGISMGGLFNESVFWYGYSAQAPFTVADIDGDGFYDAVVCLGLLPSLVSSDSCRRLSCLSAQTISTVQISSSSGYEMTAPIEIGRLCP